MHLVNKYSSLHAKVFFVTQDWSGMLVYTWCLKIKCQRLQLHRQPKRVPSLLIIRSIQWTGLKQVRLVLERESGSLDSQQSTNSLKPVSCHPLDLHTIISVILMLSVLTFWPRLSLRLGLPCSLLVHFPFTVSLVRKLSFSSYVIAGVFILFARSTWLSREMW